MINPERTGLFCSGEALGGVSPPSVKLCKSTSTLSDQGGASTWPHVWKQNLRQCDQIRRDIGKSTGSRGKNCNELEYDHDYIKHRP